MSKSYRISPATIGDVAEIDRIEREAFATPWSVDLIRAAVSNQKYDVRVLRMELVPVVGFYISHLNGDCINLDNLAVDVPYRGLGFGRQLILDWKERSRFNDPRKLTLQVNTKNTGAQKLYQELGFRKRSLLVSYYPNGEDAYQMETRAIPAARSASI